MKLLPTDRFRMFDVLLIILVVLDPPAHANPLSRLLMMKPNNKRQDTSQQQKPQQQKPQQQKEQQQQKDQPPQEQEQNPPSGPVEKKKQQEAPSSPPQKECVDPKVYQEQVAALEKETNTWKEKHQTLSEEWVKVHADAKRLSDVNDDLVTQLSKLHTQSSKELTEVKEELEERKRQCQEQYDQNEAMETKLRDSLAIQEQLAKQRVQETERMWKEELELEKLEAQRSAQNAEQAADAKCGVMLENELAKLAATALTTPANEDDDIQKAEEQNQQLSQMLSVQRVKVKVLEDEKAALVSKMEEMQGLAGKLEGKYQEKYDQREEQLRQQFEEGMEEKIEEGCRAATEQLKRHSETELAAAVKLCEEETQHKLRKKTAELDQSTMKMMQDLNQENEKLTRVLEQEHEERIGELQRDIGKLQDTIDTMKQETEMMALNSQEEQEAVKQQHQDDIDRVHTEKLRLEETIEQTKKEHEMEKLQMEDAMERAKKAHAVELNDSQIKAHKELKAAVEKTKTELELEVEKAKDHTNKVKTDLTKEISSTKEQLTKIQGLASDSARQVDRLTTQLKHAESQATYWEEKFGQRSFFNATLFYLDVSHVLGQMQEATQAQLYDWSTEWRAFWHRLLGPYTSRVGDWYSQHLKRHVDPILDFFSRQYQKHVTPLLQKAQRWRSERIEDLQNSAKAVFQAMVYNVKSSCPKWKKQLNRRKDQKSLSFVRTNLDRICQSPEESLSEALLALSVILVFVFRRALWTLLVRCVVLALRAAKWSIQLLFRSSRTKSTTNGKTNTNNETKTNGKKTKTNGNRAK